jgi:hypothetical protein
MKSQSAEMSLERNERVTRSRELAMGQVDVSLVNESEIIEAQQIICGCEHCVDNATLPFDYVLDELIGGDPRFTEYLMFRRAVCPSCSQAITEKTLVAV